MKTIEITNSSAISHITIDEDSCIVGVAYTSNKDKLYEFYCEVPTEVEERITNALENDESIGKLFHSLKKDGTIEPFKSSEYEIPNVSPEK